MIVAIDPDRARDDAREILGDRRFRSEPAPRPLRGVLRWIGDRLEPVGDAIADLWAGIPFIVWFALMLALTALAIAWFVRSTRSRWSAVPGRDGGAPYERDENPDELERDAAAAERRGNYDRAVRLRFRAGLVRLGARGTIDYRPSITVREVRHQLRSDDFEALAATFEEVAYGNRHAESPDAATARDRWPKILEQSGKR